VYVEFFLWALLTNKQLLVEFFWTRCSQPLLMAIIAATISSRNRFYETSNTFFDKLTDSAMLDKMPSKNCSPKFI
jgi:hypothetical protein